MCGAVDDLVAKGKRVQIWVVARCIFLVKYVVLKLKVSEVLKNLPTKSKI